MKLISFHREFGPAEEAGILREDGYVLPLAETDLGIVTMNDLFVKLAWTAEAGGDAAETGYFSPLVEAERKSLQNGGRLLSPAGCGKEGIRILSPVPHPMQDVICLGLNYTEHAEEAFGYDGVFTAEKAYPIFFSKRVSEAPGSGDPIPAHRDLTERLDYENELGVIIGRDARDVAEEDAAGYIFGYTIVNDVSARDLQTRHKQWYFGKSLDGFTPIGPCIVTADEIAFPPRLAISTTVNGELRQNSNTGMLIHGIAEIISTLSRGMTLKAGTIIATGTPKGVVMGMEDLPFLKAGDVVGCSIEGIGDLVNTVE